MKYIGKCLLYLLALFCVAPIWFLFEGSLMGNAELKQLLAPVLSQTDGFARWYLIPSYPTLRNCVRLLLDTPEYYVLFWNSMKVVLTILAGQFVFAVPAAWALARSNKKWAGITFALYQFCMLLPFQVTMLSQYLVLNALSMIDTLKSLSVPLIFSTFPVFIVYQSFVKLPDGVLDAAKVDGANRWQEYAHIAVPMAGHGILAAMVIGFLEYWNMVEQPVVFIQSKQLYPLSICIPQITSDNAGEAFAYSVFSILPALIVFWLGRELLVQGIETVGEIDK
jgi:multiple sugar transport system permease protein